MHVNNPKGLLNRLLGSTFRVHDSVGLGNGPRISSSNKWPEAAGLGTTLRERTPGLYVWPCITSLWISRTGTVNDPFINDSSNSHFGFLIKPI